METNYANQPLAPQSDKRRPTLVTVLCILGFIGIALSLIGALALRFVQNIPELEAFGVLPPWYSIFALAIDIFYLASLIYIWKMKKVGLITLTGIFSVNIVVALLVSPSLVFGEALIAFIIYAVVIGLFWTQYRKMS